MHQVSVEADGEVPPNATLMIEHTYDDTEEVALALLDADGNDVPFTLERRHNHAVLTPDAELEPGAYRIVSVDDIEGWLDTPFTVVADRDGDAPDAPGLLSTDRYYDVSEWGDSKGIAIEVTDVPGAAWYEYEISASATFDAPHRIASVYPHAGIGQGLCLDSYPEYRHRDRYHVRVRAVDAAGNASAWTTTAGVVRGCSTVGPAPLALGLPIGLLALATRRKGL